MKNSFISRTGILITVLTTLTLAVARLGAVETPTDAVTVARSAYSADRQAFLKENLQLTDSESPTFWPLYRQYRAEREKLGDELIKLVLEYADVYPEVPEARARELLKDYTRLEKKLADQRASYLKKFARILPAAKALRLAQLENRMDLMLRLQLASGIPLTPIEGRLTGEATGVAILAEGVPGGAVVQTHVLAATVAAIDMASRKLTLLSADGIKQTIKVGPEAVNFDQIRVGDQVKVVATEELVVYVAGEGETPSDRAAGLVALSPVGAKPGVVMAGTTQVTARIAAIDVERRKATLQFEDGSIRTIAVRPDVNLGRRKIGDKVVLRITEALAIEVAKP